MKLAGRVAMVTGGGSGIGRAICLALSREQASVVVADVNDVGARATAESIAAEGGKALALRMDITSAAEVGRAVKQAGQHFGPVDILVNNAGWDKVMPFMETTEELWDKLIAINLKGHMVVTKAVLEGMIARQYGKIVNISPEYSPASQKSDLWIGIRPGSDVAFILGVLNVLIENGWYDAPYLKRFTDMPLLVRTDTLKLLRATDAIAGY
ncbi:MAG: SDR family NAD(P)-dependent oxidoreductase, partial [Chloroflexota bacterium]